MAIVFEQQKKPVNWVKILFIVFSVLFVAWAIYYLFFAPSPRIEVVLPEPLLRANQISTVRFVDPSEVINNTTFQSLQQFFGPPSTGLLGRSNPFAPF